MKKEVLIVAGAGQISLAIARRVGFEKKIILGNRSLDKGEAMAKLMNEAGFDVTTVKMDLGKKRTSSIWWRRPRSTAR